ncbi:hypothetical protein [Mucilaginibacter polytrichastri]|uniref:Baseplate protein J-like domain-containing protein n=1 Tax=Mucilaginibacter polytrichastri TaxID=1302689 RepID=A0A1Q5ZXN0_9SPHI|nr:hypothetical protein [Mucilaginibacter polytrichastri]OKS86513.1 hypothetical protein RG47T_1969 [Mucilaginibacter polytrichastri]SFS79305.1 hypothetical protein SAMN04487890_10487 [Mucilaginibacter polytrichastri]
MATDLLSDILDGLSQEERKLVALATDSVNIDDRDIADLMKFMASISNQVNYYNSSNQIDGDWESFFTSDINVLIVLISRFDLSAHLNKYDKIESDIYTAASDEETIAAFKELFAFILDIALLMIQLYDKLTKAQNHNHITTELTSVLEGFGSELIKIRYYNYQARKLFGEEVKIDIPIAAYKPVDPSEKTVIENIFGKGDVTKEKIFHALPYLRKIFTDIRSKYNHFLGITTFYIKNHDLVNEHYNPHLALCIAFFHLYGHLKDQINEIPQIHLDHYYRNILGIEMQGALPDSVHVVFEPDAGIQQVQIKAGEQLLAEVAGSEEPVYFSLDENIVITPAKITELKTVYIGAYTQIFDETGKEITTMQAYKKEYAPIKPGAILKSTKSIETWPLLGEDQYELSEEARTMENAETGILVASPILYLSEGRRTIHLKFHLESQSFIDITNWFQNFAASTGKDTQAAAYELLSNAFIINFTGINGWQEIKRYSVKLNYLDKLLEVIAELNPDDQPLVSYNASIHGGSYVLNWPAIRLRLNNYAVYHPLAFIKNKRIERVTIRVQVKGVKTVKLQNNIGALSAANAFQPFGPQPTMGSYLDIKNTNIFNRHTRNFSITLEWIGLPYNTGGWKNYYEAYHTGITNDSFRVKLSTITQGVHKPRAQQQSFGLFETETEADGTELLSDYTQLKDIDIKRLTFSNKPLLEQEALIADTFFTDGFVRLELTAPQDAFGHQTFSKIFPEAVLHNSGRFNKKQPLPNLPYMPVIKNISIDYVLEHSEALQANSDTENEDNGLKMIYECPFGYASGYPDEDLEAYFLMPVFEMENNLYIGIRDVLPQHELSLLFQLEEKNFSSIDEDPELLQWSYLENNKWINFAKKDILRDATNNFTHTGIVSIITPAAVKTNNTLLTPGLFWIRAGVRGRCDIKSRMIGLYTNAATATRVISLDDANKDSFILQPGSVKGFMHKVKGVQNVYQDFVSYNGRPAETNEHYYIRVSERLRHKQRMLSPRDIEQSVLQNFPEILMVKCIQPEADDANFLNDGCLRVVLIPEQADNSLFTSITPKVNLATLYKVKKFLTDTVSPFIRVQVENPVYERIKLVFKIKFNGDTGLDYGMLTVKLNDDIKEYLCPWMYASESVFKVGKEIYIADILNFLKNKAYISDITGFSVVHFFNKEGPDQDEEYAMIKDYAKDSSDFIKGSVPEAVLIPAEHHLIEIMDEPRYAEPENVGIGKLAVAEELLIASSGTHYHKQPDKPTEEYFNLIISHHIQPN